MLPVETVIGESGLSHQGDKLRLDARLPWYRSLPLSTVEVAALAVDGTPVDLSEVRFELGGKGWSLAELRDCTNDFWYVLDSAHLVWPAGGIDPAIGHEVSLTIAVSPPYIPGMRRENSQTETLSIH